MSDPRWTPILVGDDAAAARRAIAHVGARLAGYRARAAEPDPRLTDGLAGDALFYAELARAELPGAWRERAEAALDAAVDRLADVPVGAGLFSGFSGVAWAVERVHALLGDPESAGSDDSEDPNEDIDDLLIDLVTSAPWTAHYDLVDGLVGIAVYALDRFDRGRGDALLVGVLARLRELAREDAIGLTWATPPHLLPDWQRAVAPHGHLNLGLAHGLPGVVALLGHAAARELAGARELLDGAVAWLLAAERRSGRSRFPVHIPIDRPFEPHESRVAWCYGDLGLAVALLGAARRAGRADWDALALDVAQGAAARPLDTVGAHDACVCHGAAGNAHLFNRLYQATGRDVFAAAARAWLTRLMTYWNPGHELGGFQTWRDGSTWRDDAGLLDGSSGVALVLLAATGDRAPAWDRFLLADL